MKPQNQKELVLHTLGEFTSFPKKYTNLTQGYWMKEYKTSKFNTRLGEVERILNIKLVNREWKPFTNRFGHHSKYRVYKPIWSKSDYIIFMELLRRKS